MPYINYGLNPLYYVPYINVLNPLFASFVRICSESAHSMSIESLTPYISVFSYFIGCHRINYRDLIKWIKISVR